MSQELIPQAHLNTNDVQGSYFLTTSRIDKLTGDSVNKLNILLRELIHEYSHLTFEIVHKPKKHGVEIVWHTL